MAGIYSFSHEEIWIVILAVCFKILWGRVHIWITLYVPARWPHCLQKIHGFRSLAARMYVENILDHQLSNTLVHNISLEIIWMTACNRTYWIPCKKLTFSCPLIFHTIIFRLSISHFLFSFAFPCTFESCFSFSRSYNSHFQIPLMLITIFTIFPLALTYVLLVSSIYFSLWW